jgi:hypothetical protein
VTIVKVRERKKKEFWERKKKKSDYGSRTEEADANEWMNLVPKDAQ